MKESLLHGGQFGKNKIKKGDKKKIQKVETVQEQVRRTAKKFEFCGDCEISQHYEIL